MYIWKKIEIDSSTVELWDNLANLPEHLVASEEFLLRVSWLLKLLPTNDACAVITKFEVNTMRQIDSDQQEPLTDIISLPGDKADKAMNFASKLKSKQIAKGYAAQISTEEGAIT